MVEGKPAGSRIAATDTEARPGWLENLRLRGKLLIALGSLLLLLLASTVGGLISASREVEARDWIEHTYSVIFEVQSMALGAREQQAAARGYLITPEDRFVKQYASGAQSFDQHLAAAKRLTADNPAQLERLGRIEAMVDDWRTNFGGPLMALGGNPATHERANAVAVEANRRHLMMDIMDIVGQMISSERVLLIGRGRVLDDVESQSRTMFASLLVLGLLAGLLSTLIAARLISAPLQRMSDAMERLARQDRRVEVPHQQRRDEIGAIARALQVFKGTAVQAFDLSWVRTHLAVVSERLQVPTDMHVFAEVLGTEVAPLLGAGFLVFYRLDDVAQALEPLGGYGAGAAPRFALGEGLVGQCAREGRALALDEVPQNYLRVASSLGSAPPRHVLLLPLQTQARMLGVIEIGSFQPVRDRARQFLDELLPIAALSLENLLRARSTQQLLEKSVEQAAELRAQSEELQTSEESLRVQREELRATNESLRDKSLLLEQQAQRLRESEVVLRNQAEELRTSNDDLREKTDRLHEQKERLQVLQLETQAKADELARVSHYKSEFLANMSHELRTPLNSLLILARGLADNESGHLDAEEVESAQIVHEAGSGLLRLINDILDLSKVEAGKMTVSFEDFALETLRAHLERNFRHVARDKGIGFEIVLAPDLPRTIVTDGGKFEQIAVNLIGNALKFTREGAVTVTLSRPAPGLRVSKALSAVPAIALRVADTGIGIPADKLARIFQAFEQVDAGTSRRYGGTGLGLSIARSFSELLGGEIDVQSEPGKGATFTLVLPEQPKSLAAPAPPSAIDGQKAAAVAPMPAAPNPRALERPFERTANSSPLRDDRDALKPGETVILIIEDDRAFQRILADMVRKKGFKALTADDGESGFALARSHRPTGILLDVNLPGIDGWAVMDRLKAHAATRSIPVHFITAQDESRKGLSMGAVGFLTKPVSREAINEAFVRLLHFAPGAPRRVLLIDDDVATRDTVREVVAADHIAFIEAGSGEAGLEELAQGEIDCIVLDLDLPGIDGFEFLDRAAARGRLPPVVVFSGRELTRDESLRLRQHTDSIVVKGARSVERLLDEVSLFLHSMPAVPEPEPQPVGAHLSGRTVLVVDDDMRNIFALSKTLRRHGMRVLMAQDGLKALKQLEENGDIDLVLMDIMMPGMDGYEALRRMRAMPRYARVPALALTARAMQGDREKCIEAGANEYLPKPLDIDLLLRRMSTLIAAAPASAPAAG